MAENFPGPYEIELFYTIQGKTHIQRLNVDVQSAPAVGDAPTSITLETRDAAGIALNVAVTAWVNLHKVGYKSDCTFNSYNFWRYDALSYVRTWITSGVVGVAGTATPANLLASQVTYTFRTLEGNVMRIVLLEGVDLGNTRIPYASLTGYTKAIMDYVVASNTWVLGRDTSYPVAQLNLVGGQNEKVFKSRYR